MEKLFPCESVQVNAFPRASRVYSAFLPDQPASQSPFIQKLQCMTIDIQTKLAEHGFLSAVKFRLEFVESAEQIQFIEIAQLLKLCLQWLCVCYSLAYRKTIQFQTAIII